MLQQPPSVQSVISYLGEWVLRSAAAIIATMAVMRIFFQPASDSYIFASLQRKDAEVKKWLDGLYKEQIKDREEAAECRHEELMKAAEDRHQQLLREAKGLNLFHEERYKELSRKCEVAEANKDSIELIRTTTDGHTMEITRLKAETRDLPRMIDALERIERAMEKLAHNSEKTNELVHTMKGEWDGRKNRRSTDDDD